MSRAPVAHRRSAASGPARALILLGLALALICASCGSSGAQTEVLGEVEQQHVASTDVQLIEAVCITNTPTHAPC